MLASQPILQIPAGTIVMFAMDKIPADWNKYWAVCDGSPMDESSDVYAAIGSNYGEDKDGCYLLPDRLQNYGVRVVVAKLVHLVRARVASGQDFPSSLCEEISKEIAGL